MAMMSGHQEEVGAPPSPAELRAAELEDGAGLAPHILLKQLHQVQEELECYYLKCLDLENEKALACVAHDDARREIDALRMQLQHLQRALVEAEKPRVPVSRLRRLVNRVTLALGRGRDDGDSVERRRRIEAMQASEWFDADWYLAKYPDVGIAGMDPVMHYDEFGWKEARNPGPGFDTTWYLQANPDVAASGMNPFWHFVQHGSAEGRRPNAS
jgi:hypothetical protein